MCTVYDIYILSTVWSMYKYVGGTQYKSYIQIYIHYIHFPQYDMLFAYITPKKTTWICLVHTEMVWEDMKAGLYTTCYLKLAQIISEFEGQRLQTRPFPNKTRTIWVLGKHTYKPAISRAGTPNPFDRTSTSKGLFQKAWWNMLPSIVSRKSYVFFVHGRKLLPVSNVIVLHWFIEKRQTNMIKFCPFTRRFRIHDARPNNVSKIELWNKWWIQPHTRWGPRSLLLRGFIPSYTPFTTMVFHRVCWGYFTTL